MASAEVKIVFRINIELVPDFVTKMQEHAEILADGYRCKAVSHEDMRCEGIDGHSGDRHSHGRFSWPNKEPRATVGHFSCPSAGPFGDCEKGPHHHWRDPNGTGWIMPGTRADCVTDHLATWKINPV